MKKTLLFLLLLVCSSAWAKGGFQLWQIASQEDKIGNSYVMRTQNGKIIVMDGGYKEETTYLRGFLTAMGGVVDMWIVSHPHPDHTGVLLEMLKNPKGIEIKSICNSRFTEQLLDSEKSGKHARELYNAISNSKIKEISPVLGSTMDIDGMKIKFLGVTNGDILVNPFNNSSLVMRVWDKKNSVLFLNDAGVECGDKALSLNPITDFYCDYIQMAHHGQAGVSENFYRKAKFRACLWPTPTWVYNNDCGKGFNTHILQTITTRDWIEDLGIKEQYVSCLLGTKRIF